MLVRGSASLVFFPYTRQTHRKTRCADKFTQLFHRNVLIGPDVYRFGPALAVSELRGCYRGPRTPVIKSWCRYCSGTKKHTDAMEQLQLKKCCVQAKSRQCFCLIFCPGRKMTSQICILTSRFFSSGQFTQQMQTIVSPVKPQNLIRSRGSCKKYLLNPSDAILQLSRVCHPTHKTHITQSLTTRES